ncbi:MAG: HD domain-containing protein, partial [bacterium]|nr:HD domain-containing protein [bacterium]
MTLFKGSGGIPSRSVAGAATALAHVLASASDLAEGHRIGHGRRVAWLALKLAPHCGVDASEHRALYFAGMLHDIGELWLQSEIFHRSGPPQRTESIDLWEHPSIGAQAIARIRVFPPRVAELIRWHHEWWDGTGYPDQLRWSQIPTASQVLRLADTFVSALAERPSRRALPPEEAYREVMAAAGREVGPHYARAFSLLFQSDPSIAELADAQSDPSAAPGDGFTLDEATAEDVEALVLAVADAADARH